MTMAAGFDVEYLFRRRRLIHDALSADDPAVRDEPGLVTLSVLSARDPIWGAYLFAYAAFDLVGIDPWVVLERFSQGDRDLIGDPANQAWARPVIAALPESSAYIRQEITELAFAEAVMSTEALRDCLDRSKNRRDFLECVRRSERVRV